MPKQKAIAPELIDDEEESEYIGEDAMSPEEMREELERLRAQLGKRNPSDLEEKVTLNVPYDATGSIVKIQGERYHGRVTVPRSVAQTILNMLGTKKEIERERLMPRGNLLRGDDLAAADPASRIIARRPRREI